jgi:hypothetical protein
MLGRINNMKLRYKIGMGVATTAAVVGMAGGAFAYFSTTSSGPATAGVGTSSNVTLSGATASDMYPGGPAQSIAFTATNGSPGHQYVGNVGATVTDVYAHDGTTLIDANGTGPNQGLCDVTNFGTASAASPVGDIPNGPTPVTVTAEQPTVSMNNDNLTGSPAQQDGCKNAIVHLSLQSS